MKENKKNDTILLKIAKSDKDEIRNRATELGMGISSYIRKMALNQRIIVKTDKEMIRQIRYIGNNINQIAHQLNMYSDVPIIEKTYKEIIEYKDMLQIIVDNISKK